MNAHIITCQSLDDYNTFLSKGYVGVNPIPVRIDSNKATKRQLAAKIETNWDVIADLKRVKRGDCIFLHTDKMIYGPYEATTFFLESPSMPNCFKSKNLEIDFWKKHYDCNSNYKPNYPWRIGIKSIKGMAYENGFSSMELFKLRSLGLIQSVPQRFQYHDKPKIVKPLLNHEVQVILQLLKERNTLSKTPIKSMNLDKYKEIRLNLKSYNNELYREKILEAWLMENITDNGNNTIEHKELVNAVGAADYFANSIFTYYTNFLDVLLYNKSSHTTKEFCPYCKKYSSKNKIDIRVIELKKGRADINAYVQLMEYKDWVTKTLANGKNSRVKAIIIANSFTADVLIKHSIECIEYTLTDKRPYLHLSRAKDRD